MGIVSRESYILVIAEREVHILSFLAAINNSSGLSTVSTGHKTQIGDMLCFVHLHRFSHLLSVTIVHFCQFYILAELNTKGYVLQTVGCDVSNMIKLEMLYCVELFLFTVIIAVIQYGLVTINTCRCCRKPEIPVLVGVPRFTTALRATA